MKTNQFIKEVESVGFKIKKIKDYFVVIDANGFCVSETSEEYFGVFSTDYVGFYDLDYNTKLQLLDLLNEYAKTPIEDREEDEKYYYKLTGFKGVQYFLTEHIDTEEVFLGASKSEQTRNWFLKSQFTDKEFAALPKDIQSHNWEKIKVERED